MLTLLIKIVFLGACCSGSQLTQGCDNTIREAADIEIKQRPPTILEPKVNQPGS
jgi:hypothetical protein